MPKPIVHIPRPPCSSPLDRQSHASHDTYGPTYTNPIHSVLNLLASSRESNPICTLNYANPYQALSNTQGMLLVLWLVYASNHIVVSTPPMGWLYPC